MSSTPPFMKLRHVVTFTAIAAAPLAAQDPTARLDTIFGRYRRTNGPGCSVGVAQKGQPLVERAYGMADLEHDVPITPATIIEAGSVSKQFTAGAVVLLALDGKLSFDDDVRKYLPELPTYERPITIRHLLNHTSGLRDWGSVTALGGWPRGTRAHTNEIALDIARHQKALNYPPGDFYSYTNTGYNLLALIVGRVSGRSLAEFTKARIFTPLGRASTSWRDDYTRIVKGRAIGYDPAPGGAFMMDMPFEDAYGNGGLLTTPSDLLRWTANLETGATLGGPKFVEAMHEQARLTSGRTITYAKGLVVSTYRDVPEISHGGATAGYRAYLARYPRQGVAVALLCNDASANPAALAHQTADAFLGLTTTAAPAPVRAVRIASTDAEEAARVAAFAGTYVSARDGAALRLDARDGQLRTSTGAVLTSLDATSFAVGAAGGMLVFTGVPSAAARTPLYLVSTDGDTVRYAPVQSFAPTAAQLAEYAGAYTSDEAEGTIIVAVKGDALELRDRYGRTIITVPPLYLDAFGTPALGVRFVRDAGRKIVALRMRESRAWDLRFVRTNVRP